MRPRALELAVVDLDRSELATILASGLSLERLVLHVEPGGGLMLADIEPVLDGSVFPELRHFGVARANFLIDDLISVLPNRALLSRLATLAISIDAVAEDSMRQLHLPSFERIEIVCSRSHPASLLAVARLARSRRRILEAISLYDEAVRRAPSMAARRGLAEALWTARRFEETAAVYDAIVAQEGSDTPAEVWYLRHYALRDAGRFDEAILSAQLARHGLPSWITATESFARILAQRGRFDEAIGILDEKRHPSFMDKLLLCEILVEAGRCEGALEILRSVGAPSSDDRRVECLRGWATLSLDPKEALRSFRRCGSREASIGSALAHADLGAWVDALAAVNVAFESTSRPDEAAAARLLGGLLLLAADREKEARRYLGDILPKDVFSEAASVSVAKRLAKFREAPLSTPDDLDIANLVICAIAAASLLRGPESADVALRAEAPSAWLGTKPPGLVEPRTLAWRMVFARVERHVGGAVSMRRADDVVSGRIDRDAFAAYLAERHGGDVAS